MPPDEPDFDEAAPADDECPDGPTDDAVSAGGPAKPRVHDSEGTLISGAQPDPADETPNNVHPINPHQNQSRLG